MSVSARFREAMATVLGMASDNQLAEATGYSQPYINQMRNGRVPPRRTLSALIASLHLSEEDAEKLWVASGYKSWNAEGALFGGLRRIVQETGTELEGWMVPADLIAMVGVNPLTDFSIWPPAEVQALLDAVAQALRSGRRPTFPDRLLTARPEDRVSTDPDVLVDRFVDAVHRQAHVGEVAYEPELAGAGHGFSGEDPDPEDALVIAEFRRRLRERRRRVAQ